MISSSTSGEIQMTAAIDRTMVAVMPPLRFGRARRRLSGGDDGVGQRGGRLRHGG